jgi:UDP-N-acetylmuramyl tripeptide synthase
MGRVVTNVQGANLPPGLAAALARDATAVAAALEVDEAWLGRVVDATDPRALALLNLSRDQLDRNNEVRQLAATWRRTLAQRPSITVVANADDPLVVWGAGAAARVCWVGAGQPWTLDASGCPSCGSRIRFDGEGWSCRGCHLRRPPLDVRLEPAKGQFEPSPHGPDNACAVIGPNGRRTDLRLLLPGRANQANAAMALTVAGILGADPARAAAAMSEVAEVVGRYAVVAVDGHHARLLLAKNPAGWLEVFDFLRPPPLPVVVVINARIADGRDPSWLWDVPFERLAGRLVVASGERSRDLAVRLRYAGVNHIHAPDPVVGVAATGAPSVDVVANYTSFQALRARLA